MPAETMEEEAPMEGEAGRVAPAGAVESVEGGVTGSSCSRTRCKHSSCCAKRMAGTSHHGWCPKAGGPPSHWDRERRHQDTGIRLDVQGSAEEREAATAEALAVRVGRGLAGEPTARWAVEVTVGTGGNRHS